MIGPPPDTTAPSIPTNVTAVPGSSSRIDVSWNASTDNIGVTGYRLFRDGIFLTSVTGTSSPDGGRVPGVANCYTVSAHDSSGNESARSAPACATTVNVAPQAFLADPVSALTGEPVAFDASGSRDSDGRVTSYAFDFGDGSAVAVQSTAGAQHAYAAAGIYDVTLTVTDDAGAQSTYRRKASVGAVLLHTANVSNTPNGYSQLPSFDGSGSDPINVVWEEIGSDILFTHSTDGGSTFPPGRPVIAPNEPYQSSNGYESSQPRMVSLAGVGGEEIHVVWTIFDVVDGLAEDFYARSSDGGATFSSPLLISPNDRVNSTSPAIAADTAGTVAITWNDEILFTDTPGAGFSVSTDTGRTFSTPALFPGVILCSTVAIAGNHIYVAWADGPSFHEQIRVAHSGNRGATFDAPVLVEPSPDQSACPQIVAEPGGAALVIWREGPVDSGRVLFARAAAGSGSFSEPVQLSPAGVRAYCPALAVGDGRIYVTWTSYDTTVFNVRSWLVFSTDGGVTFSPPRWIPNPESGAGCFQILPRGPTEVGAAWGYRMSNNTTEIFYTKVRISVP